MTVATPDVRMRSLQILFSFGSFGSTKRPSHCMPQSSYLHGMYMEGGIKCASTKIYSITVPIAVIS